MNTAKIYYDSDGNECTILQVVKREPFWAANRIQEGEKAIEELEKLKDVKSCQLYTNYKESCMALRERRAELERQK